MNIEHCFKVTNTLVGYLASVAVFCVPLPC